MSLSSTDIVNQAVQLIGDNQPPVTGVAPNFDSSPAGKAAAALYSGVVATVARQFEWDMARQITSLTVSGNVAPFPWSYEYLYPANVVQIWQVAPPSQTDPNNPLPVQWDVGNTIVSAAQKKVIWTNQASAVAICNNNPSESVWDPLFREAVVRLLASELAMAIAGRPDTSQNLLESAGAFENVGQGRNS